MEKFQWNSIKVSGNERKANEKFIPFFSFELENESIFQCENYAPINHQPLEDFGEG